MRRREAASPPLLSSPMLLATSLDPWAKLLAQAVNTCRYWNTLSACQSNLSEW